MEKKVLIGVITTIVVIIVILSAFVILFEHPNSSNTAAAPAISVSASTKLAPAGTSITFSTSITGTANSVSWNFGDGTTGNGTSITHEYSNPGVYLVFANATGPGGYGNNLQSLLPITISAQTSSNSLYASEITQPVLLLNMTDNPQAPIYKVNENAVFETSYLQLPSASGWSLAYYQTNFGNSSSSTISADFNTTSGSFDPGSFSYTFTSPGFYPVTTTIVSYNETNFANNLATTSTGMQYLPLSYMHQVLNSDHQNVSYTRTVYVASANQNASVLTGSSSVPNPGTITVAEVTHSPYSLDPAIDYDWPGLEILANVYESLIAYNGSSTASFVPIIAKEVPSLSNGGISPDGMNYTFNIRSGLKFSNGDSLTAWDVYTTMVRTLLFMLGSPGTPGWELGQDLLPGGGWDTGAVSYQNITKAISVSNSSQTVTFHLLNPDSAFLDYIAGPQGGSILDYNWLVQNGAGITFTPAGFNEYMNYSNEASYNQFIQYNAMGSGPYQIESYLTGQSILLIPNTNFSPIPGISGYNATPTAKVYIEYLKDPATALLMMKSYQADITVGLPPSDYSTAASMEAQGKLNIYTFPTLSINFYLFNWNINTTLMKSTFGTQYTVPSHYFANNLVRAAFAYALNYTDFVDDILGNAVYGGNFGFHYTGIIPLGMPGYISPNELYNVPTFDLQKAKQLMEQSGYYNTTINIPVPVYAGDSIDYAATAMWGQALSQMDSNIKITPVYMTGSTILGYLVPGQNPMPMFNVQGSWAPDFPYPPDYLNNMYLSSGFYANGLGFGTSNLQSWGLTQEASLYSNMSSLILSGDTAVNQTQQFQDWKNAERIAVNLTLYVYTYQQSGIWYYAPWIHGGQFEENPMYGGSSDTLFFYLTKG